MSIEFPLLLGDIVLATTPARHLPICLYGGFFRVSPLGPLPFVTQLAYDHLAGLCLLFLSESEGRTSRV